MLLKLMGAARLETIKLSNLQLLILSYLHLEGEQNRNDLAKLFFEHLSKPKESLRVAIAKLNQKIAKGSIVITNDLVSLNIKIESDISSFRESIENNNFEKSEELYEDYFFKGLEQDSRLELTDDLQTWLFDLREEFAEQIRTTLIQLAVKAKSKAKKKKYSEKAFLIEKAPEFFFEELEELSVILTSIKSRFAHAAESELNKLHAEGIFGHLNQKDKNILLAMAVIERYQLASSCLEKAFEQDSDMLFNFRKKLIELLKPLSTDAAMEAILAAAQEHLDNYPNERTYFVLKLAKESNDFKKLFKLYEDIYKTRGDFGNAQELPLHINKINQAYKENATGYLDSQDFQLAKNLLVKVRKTQENLGLDIDQENLFLEAYSLERQGQFSKALALIEHGQENDKLEALKSVLLLHAKDLDEAASIAKTTLSKSEDTWAQALAYNTLGTVGAHKGLYYEAIENFSKAGNRWKLINQEQRYFGATMNQATCYSYANEIEQAIILYDEILDTTADNSKLQTTLIINKADALYKMKKYSDSEFILTKLLDTLIQNNTPKDEIYCRVLANLAHTKLRLSVDKEAKKLFEEAIVVAYSIGDKLLQANALVGLGELEKNLSQIEDALGIYNNLNHSYLEITKSIYLNISFNIINDTIINGNQSKLKYLLSRLKDFLKDYQYSKQYLAKLNKILDSDINLSDNNILSTLNTLKLNLIK